jgi:enediyne biosynthesis protein E4
MRPPYATLAAMLCGLHASLATPARGQDLFVDVAPARGLHFQHRDGRTGEKYYIETAGSGGGWIDFDGDGDLDVYLVNAARPPGSALTVDPRNALYENRDGRFVEVTDRAGVGDTGYGMGFCAGDIDADGRVDFVVTNFGPDRLFHSLGDGRFEEVGAAAGVADGRWGTSCAFGDVDGDLDLDLYVAHYVDFAFDHNPFCGDRARGLRAYCRPEAFAGVTDSLFINQGDGTFRDEGVARGLAEGADEKGFGVVMSDVDDDGDLDIYVTNDGTMNRFYVNDGRGFFEDRALLAGVGLSRGGRAESGMGVALGDVDGDQRPDILVTNYSMETNTLYRNLGGLQFDDATVAAGLAEASYKLVGWGAELFDFDNDGDLDLAVANGHPIDNIEAFEPILSYRQKKQLLVNDGAGRFTLLAGELGVAFDTARVSRGLAAGDWNDDGRLDLLVTNTNDAVELLENRVHNGNHWLGIRLQGPPSNPLAFGARVTLTAGSLRAAREVRSGSSFMTQSDLRLHFGLGQSPGPVTLEIRWPDGKLQMASTSLVDRYWPIAYAPRP